MIKSLSTALVLVGMAATADAAPYKANMIWVGEGGQVDWDLAVGPSTIRIAAYKSTDSVKLLTYSDKLDATFFFWPWGSSGDTLEVRTGFVFDPDSSLAALNALPMQSLPVPLKPDGMVSGMVQAPITLPASLSKFGNWCTEVGTSYKVAGMVWAQLPGITDPRSGLPLTKYSPVELSVTCVEKPLTKEMIKTIKLPASVPAALLRAKVIVRPTPTLPNKP